MYLRPVHAELSLPPLYKFIKENPLGVLTTALQSTEHPLLQSTHIPWILDIPAELSSDPTNPVGAKLRGHLARANPHAKALIAAAKKLASEEGSAAGTPIKLQDEVMILFTSSIQHYVTPKFYVKTKPSTGKVVPTWNYAAVQAYGTACVYYDTSAEQSGDFLQEQIQGLSAMAEEELMGFDGRGGRSAAWGVDDAPKSYVELLKKAIVGVEIEITRLAGKWKMSQELGAEDREGVIEGFKKLGTSTGSEIADIIDERAKLKNTSS